MINPSLYLHPKNLSASQSGAAQKHYGELVSYCERCLWGGEVECQHNLRRCPEKELYAAFWRLKNGMDKDKANGAGAL